MLVGYGVKHATGGSKPAPHWLKCSIDGSSKSIPSAASDTGSSCPANAASKHWLVCSKVQCEFGDIDEKSLNVKGRLHPSHCLERHGSTLSVFVAGKRTKFEDGKRQSWVAAECKEAKGRKILYFGSSSS